MTFPRIEAAAARLALVAVLVLATPHASAAQTAGVSLTSAEPVTLEAEVAVRFPQGAAHAVMDVDAGRAQLRGVTGFLTVETWNVTYLPNGYVGDGRISTREHRLANATVDASWAAEEVRLNLLSGTGAVLVARGRVEDQGSPTYLSEAVSAQGPPPPDALPPLQGRYVRFDLPAGSAFVGFYMGTAAPHVGYPLEREGVLDVEGETILMLEGGRVAFIDAAGERFEYDLGAQGASSAPAAGRSEFRRMILEAYVASATIPVEDRWIAGGPSASWAVDGRILWRNATGTLTTSGGSRPFRDLDVELMGSGEATSPQAEVTDLTLREYRAEGEWSSVTLDGASALPPAPALSVTQTLTIGALLASVAFALTERGQAFGAHVVAGLYTRIARQEVLDHPTRAALHAIVAAEPGIHLRELHRRVGGAWGPFSFHVRLMQKLGAIELHKDGRYASVALPGARGAVAVPRAALAQRILAELEGEPAGATVRELAGRLEVSPQLARYHVRILGEKGLLVRDGERVRRAVPRTEGTAGAREA